MSNHVSVGLNFAKHVALAVTATLAFAAPVVISVVDASAIRGQSRPAEPTQSAPVQPGRPQKEATGISTEKTLTFDAASIKPHSNSSGGGRNGGEAAGPPVVSGGGGLRFAPARVVSGPIGVSARKIVLEAYHLTQYQLSGGPAWLDSDRFDLEAKAEAANESQLRQMLQTLLADRFKLVVHRETKEMPVYALMVGNKGTKLREWKEGDPMPAFGSGGHPNNFRDIGTMQRLADVLSGSRLGRPVLDKTRLQGVYVFYVEWDEDEDFIPAMQEQLGLRLDSQRGPVEVLLIDHVERPSEN